MKTTIAKPEAVSLDFKTTSNNGHGAPGYSPRYKRPSRVPGDVPIASSRKFARDGRREYQGHRKSAAGAAPWARGLPDPSASDGAGRLRTHGSDDAERFRREGSKGMDDVWSRVKASSSFPTLRRASVTLRNDLEDAARVVCQLHSQLASASSWTKRLIRERNASQKEVARLRAQVEQLSPGRGQLSSSRPITTSTTPNGHLPADQGFADKDNDGSCKDATESASNAGDGSTEAGSRPPTPLSQGRGCDRMVPMYTPIPTHASKRDADSTQRIDTTGATGVLGSQERPAKTKARSSVPYGEGTENGLSDGIGSVVKSSTDGAPTAARILESSCQRSAAGGNMNYRHGAELFASSRENAQGHEMNLAADANTATSKRSRRQQFTAMNDWGATIHSGECHGRRYLKLRGDRSDASGESIANAGPRGQGGKGFMRRKGNPWDDQRGQDRQSPTPEKKTRRHRGGRNNHHGGRSSGRRILDDSLPTRDTVAVGDDAAEDAEAEATECELDPAGVVEILETLVDLSTKLRRLSVEEGASASGDAGLLQETQIIDNDGVIKQPYAEDGVFERGSSTDRPTGKVSAMHTSGGALPPCERCIILSEAVQDARARAKLLERLVEQAEELRLNQADQLSQRTSADQAKAETITGDVDSMTHVAGSKGSQAVDRREASGAPAAVQELTGNGAGKEVKSAREERGVAGGGSSSEELLSAAEAVWRISEIARDALEKELDRRGEALASAKRASKEFKEAFSKQLQELSSARATLRSQQAELERWKSGAEKSSAKEKDTRRALESARIVTGDAARRSEREAKALRVEADDLKQKVSSLRTRLACVQGRRQAELETANKKIEELQCTIANLERALAHRQPRQDQQARTNVQETWYRAVRSPPSSLLDDGESPQRRGRSTSSRPQVRENSQRTQRREVYSSDEAICEINRFPSRGAPFLEAERFSDSYAEGNCTRRRASRTGRGEGGVNTGGTGYGRFTDNVVHKQSVAPARYWPAAAAESASTSTAMEIGGSGAERGGLRVPPATKSKTRGSFPAFVGESGRSKSRRRVSCPENARRDRWVPCRENARRVSVPVPAEKNAHAGREANRERILRWASRPHRAGGDSASSGWRGNSGSGRDEQGGDDRPRHEDRIKVISDACGGEGFGHRVELDGKDGRYCKENPGCSATDVVAAGVGQTRASTTEGEVDGSNFRDCFPPSLGGRGWKAALMEAMRAKCTTVAAAEDAGRTRGNLGTGSADDVRDFPMISREHADIFPRWSQGGGVRIQEITNLDTGGAAIDTAQPTDSERKSKAAVDRETVRFVAPEGSGEEGTDGISREGVCESHSLSDDGSRRANAATDQGAAGDRREFVLRDSTVAGDERDRNGGNSYHDNASHQKTLLEDFQAGKRSVPRNFGILALAETKEGGRNAPHDCFTHHGAEAGSNSNEVQGVTKCQVTVSGDDERNLPGQPHFDDASLEFWNSVGKAGLSEEDLDGVLAELTEEEAEVLLRKGGTLNDREIQEHTCSEEQVAP